MRYDLNKTIWEAPLHTTFTSLSKSLGVNHTMLRYNLAKDRKLDLILRILKWNK